MLVIALTVLNLRKAYICALRITPNFVGVQTFDGLWTIYEKNIVTKFRCATQKELGEGCTSTDNECCGKQIVDDAAPESDCLKDHRCCINPRADTNTHIIMETSDFSGCCTTKETFPWRTFTPVDAVGKAAEIAEKLNVALTQVTGSEGAVSSGASVSNALTASGGGMEAV